MSLAGAFIRNDEDTAAADKSMQRVLERLQHRPGDPVCQVKAGSILLGATGQGSCYVHPLAGVAAVFDGSLHDTDQLDLELGSSAISHAHIVCMAYLRWGADFANHLYGEFTFAVADPVQRRLIAGRDATGRSGLLYAQTPQGFYISTEATGLRDWPSVDTTLDDEMLARALSRQPIGNRTLRRGIHFADPGNVLIVTADLSVQTHAYWNPLQIPEWRAKNTGEYAEALHDALAAAVERRLPADGLVGSHLSSGFDSSGVTALAAQALARQNRPLIAYTSIPAHRSDASQVLERRFADEWPLASLVAERYPNVQHVPMPTNSGNWMEAIDGIARIWDGPAGFLRNARWFHGIVRDAEDRGVSLLLEGSIGNLTSSYDGTLGLFDLRQRGKWLQMARAVRSRLRRGAKPGTLLRNAWMPSAGTWARIQRLRGKKPGKLFDQSLMRPEFYQSTGLPPLHFSLSEGLAQGDRSNGAAWRLSLLKQSLSHIGDAGQRRQHGVRRTDPTSDRRLVELCLSIPDEAFCPEGVPRDLYRRAMKNDLPAELLNEPMRGLQASDFLKVFEDGLDEFSLELERLQQSPLANRVLDVPRMRAILNAWPGTSFGTKGAIDTMYNYTFGGALALGRYLRQLEAGEM